ncbi:hypothetical protein [Ferrovibrio sp.]|uniref:hypothetical protein n=1 Tax=Ferrovibrio sp. TaxID=1917215 RepID=UPI0025BFF888|nr:hypothetical protein [Ferrovibrio sp.]MBX3455606.1 hypothetical protein [Ferrovibrio sp.]
MPKKTPVPTSQIPETGPAALAPVTYIAADREDIPAWILRFAPFVVSGGAATGRLADEKAGEQRET